MSSSGAAILSVEQLRKSYGRTQVLHGVDLQVNAGSIHGLVGLNGAGKTTTLECILGLQDFNGGTVRIVGVAPAALHTTNGKLAVVFDSPCIAPQLTVRQVLEHARITCGRDRTHSAAEMQALLGIERYADYKITQLSLGNRRRTAIAQALIAKPDFVVLDEPFNGLDAGGVDDVLALIKRLNQQQGTTFLLASHQLSYLERVCSHMAFLHQGRMALSADMDSLLARNRAEVLLRCDNPQAALSLLRQMSNVQLSDAQPDDGIVVQLENMDSAQLNRQLVQAGIGVRELIQQNAGVDSLFRSITQTREEAA